MSPEQAVSPLPLAVAYWLHMLATVAWLGGLAGMALFVLPAARKTLDPAAYSMFLGHIQPRLQNVAWFSLALLSVTGLFQMSANPSYEGFLAVNNTWAMAILVKHLVIGLMVLTSAYVTWGLLPVIKRTAMLRAAGGTVDPAEAARLEKRELLLLNVNLVLSVVVLLLTALARSVS